MWPVGLPVEVWKILRWNGVKWLVKFFNQIISGSKMSGGRAIEWQFIKTKRMYTSVGKDIKLEIK